MRDGGAGSVICEQEAASHGGDLQIISHSPRLGCVTSASTAVKACRAPPEPSVSLLTCLPSLSFMLFCVCVCVCVRPSLTLPALCSPPVSSIFPPHLTPTPPTSSIPALLPRIGRKMFARHGCPGATLAHLSLLCRHTHAHTHSPLNIWLQNHFSGRRPIKAAR